MSQTDFEILSYMAKYVFIAFFVFVSASMVYYIVRDYLMGKQEDIYLIMKNEQSEAYGILTCKAGPPLIKDCVGDEYLMSGKIIIGSSQECDVILNDDSVKKENVLIYENDDAVFIEEITSTEKIFVNGIGYSGQVTEIDEGDLIEIGKYKFIFSKQIPEEINDQKDGDEAHE